RDNGRNAGRRVAKANKVNCFGRGRGGQTFCSNLRQGVTKSAGLERRVHIPLYTINNAQTGSHPTPKHLPGATKVTFQESVARDGAVGRSDEGFSGGRT